MAQGPGGSQGTPGPLQAQELPGRRSPDFSESPVRDPVQGPDRKPGILDFGQEIWPGDVPADWWTCPRDWGTSPESVWDVPQRLWDVPQRLQDVPQRLEDMPQRLGEAPGEVGGPGPGWVGWPGAGRRGEFLARDWGTYSRGGGRNQWFRRGEI